MQTPPPKPPAAERVLFYLRTLTHIIVTHHLIGLIPGSLASPIIDRLRDIKERIEILAASIQNGTWRPRRPPAPRQTPPGPSPLLGRPRAPSKFPLSFNWLAAFLGPHETPHPRGGFSTVMNHPDTMALLEKAPPTLIRSIRSLHWMLGLKPPAALPKPRPRKPRPKAPTPEPAAPPPPAPAPDPAMAAALLKWAKPRGSLSNDLRRKAWPHRSRLPKNSA